MIAVIIALVIGMFLGSFVTISKLKRMGLLEEIFQDRSNQ